MFYSPRPLCITRYEAARRLGIDIRTRFHKADYVREHNGEPCRGTIYRTAWKIDKPRL